MANKCMLVLLATLVVAAVIIKEAEADVLIGSCVWGAVDYKSDCAGYCKKRGYSGGHCGSAFNVNCWCET